MFGFIPVLKSLIGRIFFKRVIARIKKFLSNTIIGNNCTIDNNVTVAHDNIIEDGVHIAPGASLGSSIKIGKLSVLGIGCSVSTNINIVITDLMFYDFYERSLSFSDIEKYLLPAGFKLYDISHVSKNPMNGRTDWVDVIYVNDKLNQ